MKIIYLTLWNGGDKIVVGAMNANGCLSWNNVLGVPIDRVTIHSDQWRGEWTPDGAMMRTGGNDDQTAR